MKEIKLTGNKSTQKIELETPTCDFVDNASSVDVLGIKLNNEITRATGAEKALDSKIDAETSRAIAREDELESQIKQAGKVDDVLVNDVSVLGEDKIARVDLTPYAKESDLSSEISRAKEAESSLSVSISEVRQDLISEAIRAAYLTASNGLTFVCGFKIKDIISPTAISTDIIYPEGSYIGSDWKDTIVEWAQAFIDNIDDLWAGGLEEMGEWADMEACWEYFQEIIDNIDDFTVAMLNAEFQKFVKHWDILRKYPHTLEVVTECFTYPGHFVDTYDHFTGKSTGDYINRIDKGSAYYLKDSDDASVYFKYFSEDGAETDITISRAEFEAGTFFFEIINTADRGYTPSIKFSSFETDKIYHLSDEEYDILSNTGYSAVNVVIGEGKFKHTFHRAANLGGIHVFTSILQDTDNSYYHAYALWVKGKEAHFTAEVLATAEDLSGEQTARVAADSALQTNIDSESAARQSADKTLQSNIDDITALIPSQAASDNQLADKDYVNSSIATSTATFRGTVGTLEELKALTGDLNDYAFVEVKDETTDLTLRYDRYKYSDVVSPETGNWAFEYSLNNSSFTSDQWKAITSGITSDLVGQITTNKEAISSETTRATAKESELEKAIKEAGKIDDVTVATPFNSKYVSIVADKIAKLDLTGYLPFSNDYVLDVRSWVHNGLTKTRNNTANLPWNKTCEDNWGVLMFVQENAALHNGMYIYWDISEKGEYGGSMWLQSRANGSYSDWQRVTTEKDLDALKTAITTITDSLDVRLTTIESNIATLEEVNAMLEEVYS